MIRAIIRGFVGKEPVVLSPDPDTTIDSNPGKVKSANPIRWFTAKSNNTTARHMVIDDDGLRTEVSADTARTGEIEGYFVCTGYIRIDGVLFLTYAHI